MYGSQSQQMGLFTFYREQAQSEQQLLDQRKISKEKRKKQKGCKINQINQEDYQGYQQYEEQQKKNNQNKVKSLKPILTSQDYTEKAKRYIKQLESGGGAYRLRLVYSKRNQGDKLELDDHEYFSANYSRGDGINSSLDGMFRNKKQYHSKFDHYYFDKIALVPKQFQSMENIVKKDKNQQIKGKKNSTNVRNKKSLEKRSYSYLPAISQQRHGSSMDLKGRMSKDKGIQNLRSCYNHKDIITNNQKFMIREISKKSKSVQEMQRRKGRYKSQFKKKQVSNQSILDLLQKYPLLQ